MLIIDITFNTIDDRNVFLELFKPLALYVAESEPDTLAYEAAIADNNPCRLTIFERCAACFHSAQCQFRICHCLTGCCHIHLALHPKRPVWCRYTDKDNAFLKVHQQSAPFKAFRQGVQEKNVGIASKTGQSYIETDVGFM